ncbi:MAG: iron ABC transporter permease [Clostridia bacterium]|nr:iron ABC transporter permease [Clostridia bacterium]
MHKTKNPIQKVPAGAYQQYIRRKWMILIIMVLLTAAAGLGSLMAGSAGLSLKDVIFGIFRLSSKPVNTIIWNVRMPRIAAALVVGVALAMCGCIMQNVLRNPLASASTLGVSQGASFGAAVSIIWLGAGSQVNTGSGTAAALTISNPMLVTLCAFLGGVATTLVILALARMRGASPSVMVLAGVAISSMFSGGTTLVQYFADDVMVATVVHWTFGNLGRAGWKEIELIGILGLLTFAFFYYHRWNYNAMESGMHTAKSLGVPVDFLIPASMILCALISSVSVAFVGCISFIGLIAAHIMRRFVGNDFRFLIPCTALCGAVLLLASDIACRMLAPPAVLPIGALTSFLGAPLFLWLIIRRGSIK